MKEVLRDLITISQGAVVEALRELEPGDNLPVTYAFFGRMPEGEEHAGEPGLIDTISEEDISRKMLESPMMRMVQQLDSERFGKFLHQFGIDYMRKICAEEAIVEWLLITAEAWITKMGKDGETLGKRYEVMTYVAHHRDGEALFASQEILRPAGQPPQLYGPIRFSGEDPPAGTDPEEMHADALPLEVSVGAMMQFFPSQLSEEARARGQALRDEFDEMMRKREERMKTATGSQEVADKGS